MLESSDLGAIHRITGIAVASLYIADPGVHGAAVRRLQMTKRCRPARASGRGAASDIARDGARSPR